MDPEYNWKEDLRQATVTSEVCSACYAAHLRLTTFIGDLIAKQEKAESLLRWFLTYCTNPSDYAVANAARTFLGAGSYPNDDIGPDMPTPAGSGISAHWRGPEDDREAEAMQEEGQP